jgi:hypothetical protein
MLQNLAIHSIRTGRKQFLQVYKLVSLPSPLQLFSGKTHLGSTHGHKTPTLEIILEAPPV